METYAFVQDLPLPVSRGSYRFGTRTVSPSAENKRLKLIYIKSGVKTPLLSDLEAKSDNLRYGLDVIQRHSVPNKTPNTVTRNTPDYSNSVPPPTANTNFRGSTAGRKYLYVGRSKTALDFNKLCPYNWNSTREQEHLPPVAPDPLYKNTYISKLPEVRTQSPEFKMRRGLALYEEERKENENRPHTVHGMVTNQQTKSARPVTRHIRLQHIRSDKSLVSKFEANKLQLYVRPFDQREKLEGPNGCLHAQVKHSIKYIKKVEKGELLEIPVLSRPMNSEKGKYRPHSRTKIPKTPPLLSADTNVEDKTHKSAEVYVQFVKKKKIMQVLEKDGYATNPMATPGMTEIIAKYITPGAYEDSPRTSMTRDGTNNPPASRCSTGLESKIPIPEWAENERKITVRIRENLNSGKLSESAKEPSSPTVAWGQDIESRRRVSDTSPIDAC